MTPAILDFTIWRGSILSPIVFTVKDGSGNIVNLTGWSVFANARNGTGKVIDLAPIITNTTGGQVTISLTSAQTSSFKTGNQQWDMTFQNPSQQVLGPYIAGTITVNNPVTHG